MQRVKDLKDSNDVGKNRHRHNKQRDDRLFWGIDELAFQNKSEARIEAVIIAEFLGECISVKALIEEPF